jgi:sterol desaturase/sphingolipid hydroxylase (fatty acid hydroxylase superfamily)
VLRKIDVRDIVIAHYRTLRDNRTSRSSLKDVLLFFLFPALLASAYTAAGLRLGKAEALLAAVSIVGAFLFALLILVLQMSADAAAQTEEIGKPSSRTLRRIEVLRQLSANVAYAVLVSVLTTTSLAIGNTLLPSSRAPQPGELVKDPEQPWWISGISVFLLIHLVLTLLMVP